MSTLHPPAIRGIGADDWRLWRRLRRAALADAPAAFGSTLAEWSGAGDTEERWRARLRDVPANFVASVGGDPVGMVSAAGPDAGEIELISLWVAPAARGSGVGDALIGAVVEHARGLGVGRVALSVRASNEAAFALYERNGFVDVGPGDRCAPSGDTERRMHRRL